MHVPFFSPKASKSFHFPQHGNCPTTASFNFFVISMIFLSFSFTSNAASVNTKQNINRISLLGKVNRIRLGIKNRIIEPPPPETQNATSNPLSLCASSCVVSCNAKWHTLKDCYKTKWGCFQGCHRACNGDVACPNKCMKQLDWTRCTREACKLGCFLGSTVESRYPSLTEEEPGDGIEEESGREEDEPSESGGSSGGEGDNTGPSESGSESGSSSGGEGDDTGPSESGSESGSSSGGEGDDTGPSESGSESGSSSGGGEESGSSTGPSESGSESGSSSGGEGDTTGPSESGSESGSSSGGEGDSTGPSESGSESGSSTGPSESGSESGSSSGGEGDSTGPSESGSESGSSSGSESGSSSGEKEDKTGPSESGSESGSSSGSESGSSSGTAPAESGPATVCTPKCTKPNSKTLYDCFGRNYPNYQEKISKMFNLPNTKTAEANTNLLLAWKKCNGEDENNGSSGGEDSKPSDCHSLGVGDEEENCKKWEAQQQLAKSRSRARLSNAEEEIKKNERKLRHNA
jgi:hypothetical protein